MAAVPVWSAGAAAPYFNEMETMEDKEEINPTDVERMQNAAAPARVAELLQTIRLLSRQRDAAIRRAREAEAREHELENLVRRILNVSERESNNARRTIGASFESRRNSVHAYKRRVMEVTEMRDAARRKGVANGG